MGKYVVICFLCPSVVFCQIQFGQTLFGNSNRQFFGTDLAFSSDNNRMVVADNKDASGSITGYVRVYEFNNNSWSQIGQTLNGHANGNLQGIRVAISSDGQRIAVGTTGNSTTILESGSIKVYEFINDTWIQIGQEILPLTIGEIFAFNISLSSDGSTLAAGANQYNGENGTFSGYVRVFTFINDTWENKGSLLQGSDLYGRFGLDTALSEDGNVLACSNPSNSGNPSYIKIFEYNNDDWEETGIINEEIFGERIGSKIQITPDAQTIVIAINQSNVIASNAGQVRVYHNINDNWVQKGSSIFGLAAGDLLGSNISISDDGNILAIGAPHHNFNLFNMGYIDLYRYINNDWVLLGEQIQGDNSDVYVGYSFALSPDGSILGVGYQYDDTNYENSGKVITYDLSAALSVDENNLIEFNLFPNPATTSFTIEIPQHLELKGVAIYNDLGQLVTTTTKSIVNISSLSSGVYVVEIITNKGKASKKLIIE
ncbi:hypothetical protein C1T31_01375 [Hanstruepera neustonica]|uniref:Secretion system C-terminal sorting domain-containing protein n=1 Tax=Hanstruepera neustonica TaxID=1445657 RepID=A0A2K1E3G8_9FLAO|nr:T9SS type A sorting domain-containing protein [Hanstruepera neustonica]PNQ74817.1 hypothetical protein C1T31_01375 [Hanstruepera neustonica]